MIGGGRPVPQQQDTYLVHVLPRADAADDSVCRKPVRIGLWEATQPRRRA